MALIALVDDDDGVRPSIRKMIEADGHTVIEFNDGAPAIDAIGVDGIDLVVTDLKMETPGGTLIRSLRAKGNQVPILVITGHVVENDINHLLNIGASSVLHKPFTLDEIQDKVKRCLETAGEKPIIVCD